MEKTNKIILILSIALLILIGLLTFIFFGQTVTGKVINQQDSFIAAICNDTKSCQDYEITCQDSEILTMTPISGAVVQYSPFWNDPRNETDLDNLC